MALEFVERTEEERAELLHEDDGPPRPDMFQEDRCANCLKGLELTNETLYCDKGCRDMADTVRYIRRKLADGVLHPVQVRYGLVSGDLAEALYNRLRFAVAGGYRRTTTRRERAAVIARDAGRCVRCGGPGEHVDHIRGDDGAMSNRQLLCRDCHARKTQAQSREGIRLLRQGRPTPSWRLLLRELVDSRPRVRALIAERILPAEPVRWADTASWDDARRQLKSDRYARLKDLMEALFDYNVPDFPPYTRVGPKMEKAIEHHADEYDEVPCSIAGCPVCDTMSFGSSGVDPSPDAFPSVEAWSDDPDVHAGYDEGSYFAEAMARDD